MADITAFRGIRYDLGHIGSLANVTAPPYDVIDRSLQNVLYKRHPANVVRLILNRDEPGDDAHQNRYTRAARFLRNWRRENVLFQEADPAIYVYHQKFDPNHPTAEPPHGTEATATGPQGVATEPNPGGHSSSALTRRGFIARVRLEPFGTGNIHPHEETHTKAKEDRFKLWQACQANLSPIFGVYPDPQNHAQELLEMAILGQTPIEVTDDDGTRHRLWPVTDVAVITALTGAMGAKPLYIADGHHRYETALAYRDALAAQMGSQENAALPADHPANSVLMNCVSMNDPGMIVLPTHRLFRGLPPITADQFIDRLGNCFRCRKATEFSLHDADSVWHLVAAENSQGRLAFFTAADQQWILADITDAGQRKMASIAAGKSAAWRSLGVSILHRLVIDTLLDAPALPTPKYVRAIPDLIQGLTHGDDTGRDATGQEGSGGQFELAACVMPASLELVQAVSRNGERMPAKSTFFYPKVLSGLVINPLT